MIYKQFHGWKFQDFEAVLANLDNWPTDQDFKIFEFSHMQFINFQFIIWMRCFSTKEITKANTLDFSSNYIQAFS